MYPAQQTYPAREELRRPSLTWGATPLQGVSVAQTRNWWAEEEVLEELGHLTGEQIEALAECLGDL